MVTADQKAKLRVLSIVLAAACAVLGVVYGWPMWLWIGLVVVLLLAPTLIAYGLVEWSLRKKPRAPLQEEFDEPEPESQPVARTAEPSRYGVQSVYLRSAHQDYRFSFGCTVVWRLLPNAPGLPHPNPGVLGADLIVAEATKLAASIPPEEESSARYRMMNVLGLPRTDPSNRIEVWAEDVVLGLSEDDAKRLARLAKVRKDEEAWEYERRYERSVRSYLSDDVFTSQGSAAVWWLAGPRTDEKQRVDEAVAKLDHLRVLTRVASGEEKPPVTPMDGRAEAADFCAAPPPMELSSLLVQSMTNGHSEEPSSLGGSAMSVVELAADGPERAMFTRQLADLLEVQGHHDVAQEMRDRFDAPTSQKLDGDSSESEEGIDSSEERDPEQPVQDPQREDSPPEVEPRADAAERMSSGEERTSG